MTYIKTEEHNGSSYTITVDVHSGVTPAPDNNPFGAVYTNTVSVDTTIAAPYQKPGIPDAELVDYLDQLEDDIKAYIDSAKVINDALIVDGYSIDDTEEDIP